MDGPSSPNGAENFLINYRGLVFSLLAVIFLGVFAWGFSRLGKEEDYNRGADRAYRLQQGPLTSLRENPGEIPQFLESFKSLAHDHGDQAHVVLLGLEVANFLKGEGKYVEALNILETIRREDGENLGQYLVALNMAAVAEEMNQAPRALEILEALVGRDQLIWEENVYLNLGRLYLDGGSREKARTHFLYIVDKAKEAEVDGDILKQARLYLERMEGE